MLAGPLVWTSWHAVPQQAGVWHSQPVVFEPDVLQFEYAADEQVYPHAVPLVQFAVATLSVPHATPQPPQLVVVVIGVSQPLLFGAAGSQSL
jgi:hypothetical protein